MGKPIIRARMHSKCGTCTGDIHAGDRITKRGSKWHHPGCVGVNVYPVTITTRT